MEILSRRTQMQLFSKRSIIGQRHLRQCNCYEFKTSFFLKKNCSLTKISLLSNSTAAKWRKWCWIGTHKQYDIVSFTWFSQKYPGASIKRTIENSTWSVDIFVIFCREKRNRWTPMYWLELLLSVHVVCKHTTKID